MNQTLIASHLIAVTVLLGTNNCSSSRRPVTPDQRLTDVTKQSLEQQARQNETIARQSESVVQESRRLAETAKTLVEKDAEARREMVSAQRELQKDLLQQQTVVNAERDRLEQDRRQLAQQRGRDPIIASAIQYIGGLLACLLPLVVCVYLLYRTTQDNADQMALGEMLVQELSSEHPLVLSGPLLPRPLALEDRRPLGSPGDASSRTDGPKSDNAGRLRPPRRRRRRRRRPAREGQSHAE